MLVLVVGAGCAGDPSGFAPAPADAPTEVGGPDRPDGGLPDVPSDRGMDDVAADMSMPVGFRVMSADGLRTTERGGQAMFTVALLSAPTAPVMVALASEPAGEGSPSPASLTFTPVNWNAPQTVTVTGVDDLVADGDASYTHRARPRHQRRPALQRAGSRGRPADQQRRRDRRHHRGHHDAHPLPPPRRAARPRSRWC